MNDTDRISKIDKQNINNKCYSEISLAKYQFLQNNKNYMFGYYFLFIGSNKIKQYKQTIKTIQMQTFIKC